MSRLVSAIYGDTSRSVLGSWQAMLGCIDFFVFLQSQATCVTSMQCNESCKEGILQVKVSGEY